MDTIATFLNQLIFFKIPFFGTDLPLVVLWLIIGAVYFTYNTRFVNIKGFKHSVDLTRGKYYDPKNPGEVTPFQALCTAISGTVGIGNIGGVAVAVTVGGAGATFWMILAGFLGMSTKFAESILGVRYRVKNADGSVSGGPMYYLREGLKEQGLPKLGKFLGIFYAASIVIAVMGAGNMFQANQTYVQLNHATGGMLDGYGWLVGLVLAVVVWIVIVGGIKSIVKVTEKIVPIMALLYCGFGLVVIAMNGVYIPQALQDIVVGAFTSQGVAGGALGAMIIGFQRAVYSNEAGLGCAAIAHSAVKTDNPCTEGYVSLLEPFIDTIIICTITALVITTTNVAQPGYSGEAIGVAMTSLAFERHFDWFSIPLALAGLMFAFSTIIAWSYYGLKGWTYLFGENTTMQRFYQTVFCAFIVIGTMTQLGPVLKISDAFVFIICVPNILGMLILAPVVKQEMKAYNENFVNRK